MALTVPFPNPVRDWIISNLQRGCAAPDVVRELCDNNVEEQLANAMVNAVMQALMAGSPLPEGQLLLAPLAYVADPCRLPAAPVIACGDRDIRILSRMSKPTAAVLGNVINARECEQLIELARPRLRPSTVVDPSTGQDVVADHRSSEGMFFRLMETPLLEKLDRRLAALTGLPVENGEGFQILHYRSGAGSAPHFDYLTPSNVANAESVTRSGQRIITVVIYLNDVAAGGETVFPEAGWAITPQQGNAIYFEYCNRQGQVDPASLHASSPVLKGEKWVATKWIRERRFISR
ncbi:prolyl 4-hydroxylase [Silvimonas terrae]|uniref:Prolyl 4-hydroxylase n=1 Tax=Silvimonas terrae TaxID=300266 RepID=A0A840RHI0_9NEIS|nr:2OG-Fe(II) oxygenase [Silvimonas terrae]MBB5192537.1 prolyl 4-hydroxylase [Silvimonas terrae]